MQQQQQQPKTYHSAALANYVSPGPGPGPRSVPASIQLAPHHEVAHTINAPLSATQHVEMKTSSVDRAKGFLIASVPLYAAFALGVLLVSVLFANVPFWSFWGLSVFWLSFVLAWLWGYRETLNKSAEGIAHYESRMKWSVIMREQDKRWEYYDNLVEVQRGRADE